jgi:hypothetical protein
MTRTLKLIVFPILAAGILHLSPTGRSQNTTATEQLIQIIWTIAL